MNDDPLTIWIEKVLKWFAVLMASALILLWLTGCYKPTFHITFYETHTHTSPSVNPSGLNSNEIRGGGDFLKGELDELSQRVENDLGRSRGNADGPGAGL